ncbi:hypothetical protein [Streptomyces cyaneofuscatus]|uniref:hypothetical protein n=1 Tax=Streptomyces cyaneofuscatus TaxID=66883 RepID=UPI003669E915
MEADPVRRLLHLLIAETDSERRAFLAKAAYTVTTTAVTGILAYAVDEIRRPTTQPGDAEVSSVNIQVSEYDALALGQMTQAFASLVERHGGGHVRSMLTTYLNDQVRHSLRAPASAQVRSDLLAGAAQLTHLLAMMNDDSGHYGLAQSYFHSALHLAREARAPHLQAITLRAMSAQALRLGHPLYALHLAEAAVEIPMAHDNPSTTSFLLTQRAHTYAVTGDRHRASADLIRAENHHARASSTDDPFGYYPRAALEYQRSQCLEALGEANGALNALASSAAYRAAEQRKSLALTQARLAELHLKCGHVEAAMLHAELFLEKYPHLHSTQADFALHQLKRQLSRYPRQAQAVDLRERVTALLLMRGTRQFQ